MYSGKLLFALSNAYRIHLMEGIGGYFDRLAGFYLRHDFPPEFTAERTPPTPNKLIQYARKEDDEIIINKLIDSLLDEFSIGASFNLPGDAKDKAFNSYYFPENELNDLLAELRDMEYSMGNNNIKSIPITKRIIEVENSEKKQENSLVPFVAMSFRECDRNINDYILNILKALEIKFETGEKYSKNSVPIKVKERINKSDLFIDILVKRDKIEDKKYTTPSWLIKELGIAQGAGKDVIALVEKGIQDIAGLESEKEIIYFERDNIDSIKKATIKFLEALKAHNLID